MLNVISRLSIKDVATTYVANVRGDRKLLIEFVESTPQPQSDRGKKWVIIVSSQIGCALRCRFCDASGYFYGNLSKDEIVEQVDYVIQRHKERSPINTQKFKIQFARMGEPSLNLSVIDAMLELININPAYIPCIATAAPVGSEKFFDRLIEVRDYFRDFQLQFSINSTDEDYRDYIMPFKKMPLEWIGEYSDRFYSKGRRKVVLNFALRPKDELNCKIIKRSFNPQKNIIKLTPINPTQNSKRHGFEVKGDYDEIYSYLRLQSDKLKEYGFETIISIGDLRENILLSNCGQIANAISKN
ncbi:MAG: radical SAM protein [Myxococcota bacterium]